jgi:6-phosphogluconolactonase
MNTRWHVCPDDPAWLEAALTYVGRAEAKALAERGAFHIVLAGGATPLRLYQALASEAHDWSRWQIWYGDERCLPPEHAERNSRMASAVWLDRVAIPGTNVHPIAAELGPEKAAEGYAVSLCGLGLFDLVLLGLGEDGHTASLFPDRDWGADPTADTLAVYDAPKPPARRVSLSARRLSMARQVLFLVVGAGKRDAVADWRNGAKIPAAAIMPAAGVDVLMTRDAVPVEPSRDLVPEGE